MTERVLEVSGLRKAYGELVAVAGVDLTVGAGETYGLLGPNGAGKTTTISMIAGLLAADGGTVTVDGSRVSTRTVAGKASVGLVPQELAIYPDLTARENLAFFGALYGLRGAHLKSRIAAVLELIGLEQRADDRAEQYSGGMQRRLNIGVGLLHTPKLLILDEPTVGVDPQSRNAILESVEHLAADGMAVLYTTHYMEEAERLCDRVGIIDEGEVKAEGTRRELVAMVGQLDQVRLAASGPLDEAVAALGGVDGIDVASRLPDGLEVMASDARGKLPMLLSAAADEGLAVTSVEVAEPDLEAVFLRLTGKALRD